MQTGNAARGIVSLELFDYVFSIHRKVLRFKNDYKQSLELVTDYGALISKETKDAFEQMQNAAKALTENMDKNQNASVILELSGGMLVNTTNGNAESILNTARETYLESAHRDNSIYIHSLQFTIASFEGILKQLTSEGYRNLTSYILIKSHAPTHPQRKEKVKGIVEDKLKKIGGGGFISDKLKSINSQLDYFSEIEYTSSVSDRITFQEILDITEIFEIRHLHTHHYGEMEKKYRDNLEIALKKIQIWAKDNSLVYQWNFGNTIYDGYFHWITIDYLEYAYKLLYTVLSKIAFCFTDMIANDDESMNYNVTNSQLQQWYTAIKAQEQSLEKYREVLKAESLVSR